VELDGKRILISGATGGLGRAIAEQLAGAGAKLVLSSRRQKELLELAEALPGGERTHDVIVSDLAEAGAAEKLIRDAGDLDGLVANASLPASGRLDAFSHDELARAIRVNLEAPIHMSAELAPALEEKGEGHIVFISSLAGHAASPRSSLYSATKFGLRGFAFGLREDLHPSGVGVSVVSPGFVRDAGMMADSGAPAPAGMGTTTPKKVAKAVERAMDRNRSEITVAPWHQVRLAKFAGRHPEVAGRATRRGRMADKAAEAIADGQADKR
jgi:short-subunit dehydrogenase